MTHTDKAREVLGGKAAYNPRKTLQPVEYLIYSFYNIFLLDLILINLCNTLLITIQFILCNERRKLFVHSPLLICKKKNSCSNSWSINFRIQEKLDGL